MTATRSSPEDGAPQGHGRARDWVVIAVSLAAAGLWVTWSQGLGARITVESEAAATAIFFVLLFAPLYAIAIGAGRISRVAVMRAGERRLAWSMTGAGLGLGGLLCAAGFAWLQGGVVVNAPARDPAMFALGFALILFQVSAEEVFFRGWIQPALSRKAGPVAAVALAALLFTGFHVTGGARAPVSLVNIFLAGVLFGLLALRSGGILASIAAHFAWNVTENLGLGLDPNPGIDIFGGLLDIDLAGAPIWGGNPEGLNASVGTAAVLVALILPVLAAARTARAPQSLPVAA